MYGCGTACVRFGRRKLSYLVCCLIYKIYPHLNALLHLKKKDENVFPNIGKKLFLVPIKSKEYQKLTNLAMMLELSTKFHQNLS